MSEKKLPKMFVMCGHPGSGKSYFAKRFAELNGYRYLAIDDTYAYFNGDPHSHENKFDVWMTFFRQIHAAELAGVDVVIDTNAPTMNDRNEFLNWFTGFDHHLIWVVASEALCLKNNNNRARVIPTDQMQKIFDYFETPGYAEFSAFSPRAQWKSFTTVENYSNLFKDMYTYCGDFPKDTKKYNQQHLEE